MSNLLNLIFINFFIKTSSNLYIYWNIGSLLMMMMSIQIVFGFLLANHYFFYSENMFSNSFFIFFNFNYGWMLRFFHSNMTSMIFILMFIHMARSLMYKNFMNKKMWFSGLMMILVIMAVSYMGYTLIMNQMAYWASMVITNFLATIPIIGTKIMLLLWGNRFIDNILLNRFFAFHYILAISIMMMSLIHLVILHLKKSSNPLSINNNLDQVNLNPLLIFKDVLMFMIMMMIFLFINMILPTKMNNPDNFNKMMIFKTPSHIEPEWYFLFFYAILRSNKNKLNGLLMMFVSILIWFLIPMVNKTKFYSNKFFLVSKIILMILINLLILMTFIGTKTSKEPYLMIIKMLILIYFMMFKLMFMVSKLINKI